MATAFAIAYGLIYAMPVVVFVWAAVLEVMDK